MSTLNLKYLFKEEFDGTNPQDKYLALETKELRRFNSGVLGLGNLKKDGKNVQALTAFFDLAGFTTFCDQSEPHLVVPNFLSMYLEWLFDTVSEEITREIKGDVAFLWSKFPFCAKFLGDGVLFMWDTELMDRASIANIVVSLRLICDKYVDEFLPKAQANFSSVPSKLRCGIARGQVVALGDGSDFVGPSINLAARLQKVGSLGFAFSNRGFMNEDFSPIQYGYFKLVKTSIRGIGNEELIYVLKSDYDALPKSERKLFTSFDS